MFLSYFTCFFEFVRVLFDFTCFYVYCSQATRDAKLPKFQSPKLAGVHCRLYLIRYVYILVAARPRAPLKGAPDLAT